MSDAPLESLVTRVLPAMSVRELEVLRDGLAGNVPQIIWGAYPQDDDTRPTETQAISSGSAYVCLAARPLAYAVWRSGRLGLVTEVCRALRGLYERAWGTADPNGWDWAAIGWLEGCDPERGRAVLLAAVEHELLNRTVTL